MKKKIIILVAIAISIMVYRTFTRVDYTGSVNFLLDGKEYNWTLERTDTHNVDDSVIYETIYSDGGDSIRIVFKIWEENGETYIHLDNPTIQLDGERCVMTRTIQNSDYSIDALSSSYIRITFWDLPFDGGIYLNGGFTFEESR